MPCIRFACSFRIQRAHGRREKICGQPINMVLFTEGMLRKRGMEMSQSMASSSHQQMLHRPRVDALIHEGLQQPLLVILAGPGYGKTQAVSDYASRVDANIVWLRLSVLDNLVNHFWDHLLRMLKQNRPGLFDRLSEVEFPDTISDHEIVIQLIAKSVCCEKQTIWVLDDYGAITNQQVKDFVRMLVEANIERFHLILMSNVLDTTESIAFMTRKRALLLAEDLRFTKDEIHALYQLHGIALAPDDLSAVERYTEGWPLPLHMLVLQFNKLPDMIHQGDRLTNHAISHLFEERFFSNYPKPQQKLIVKLSMLNSFTKKFAISLYSGDAVELEALGNHAFLISEQSTDRFFLHYLYRLFLRDKSYLISKEEERDVWQQAARYYIDAGDMTEAVACYRKAEDHIGMMEAVSQYIYSQSEMTASTALYFLEHIALLTPTQLTDYPRANYMRAYVYMILVRLEEAEALLLDLENRLLGIDTQDSHDLLCDVYSTLGLVRMMENREDFVDAFRRAADEAGKLPPEILAKKSGLMRMHNGNAFSMSNNLPGAKERMERAVYQAVPHMAKIWSGDISGIEYMFSAESAYLSFQLDAAKQHAYQCVYKAETYAQHDLVCNAYRLLARIGYMQGDYSEMTRQLECAAEYAGRYDNGVMRKIRDNALAWYYIKLHDHAKIPQSILELSRTEVHNLAYGRPQVTYAHYLFNIGEYARMVGMMRNADKGLYLSRGIWQERIDRHVMLAIGYDCLGNHDMSMDALWSAYDLCYDNGLIAQFIEAAGAMNKVIQVARQQDRYSFSPEWLDLIDRETAAFAKRADKVRAAYYKRNPIKTNRSSPLSQREQDVLGAISRGLTREEIAYEQYVSVNTVKSTIRNIYNKLGASNKAEAVSIAIAKGYMDGYTRT